MKKLRFYLINVLFSLFCGLFIYIFFRRGTYINDFVNRICHIHVVEKETVIIHFLKYYFVDALWAYAMTFFLAIFVNEKVCFLTSSCVCILWELFQLFSIVKGTFDWIDIIMYLTAVIIAVLIIFFYKKGEMYEKTNP